MSELLTSPHAITSVSEFAPHGDKTDQLLQYPYNRPEGSFITDGTTVTTLSSNPAEFYTDVTAMLSQKGLPPLDERIPIIAYGANASPARIQEKMSAFGGNDHIREQMQTVPMLEAAVPDAVVAWHGVPGQTGSTFSELYKGDETKDESAPCVVQFLTNEQLALVHATEGSTYHFMPVDVQLADGATMKAVAYVAGSSEVVLKNGKPIPMKLASAHHALEGAMTAEEAVDYMLEASGVAKELGAATARELIALNLAPGTKLADKKARQERIGNGLESRGLSRKYTYANQGEGDWYYLRSDFSGLNHVGHTPTLDGKALVTMPEMALAELQRPTPEELAEKVALLAAADTLSVDAFNAKITADSGVKPKEYADTQTLLRRARASLDIMTVLRGRNGDEIADFASRGKQFEAAKARGVLQ